MILSKAVEGFLLEKVAAGRSAKTTEQYRYVLDRFKTFVADVDVNGLDVDDVRRFLAWLRTDYKPQRFSGETKPVSDKTVVNFYTALSSFWSWLVPRDFSASVDAKGIGRFSARFGVINRCEAVSITEKAVYILILVNVISHNLSGIVDRCGVRMQCARHIEGRKRVTTITIAVTRGNQQQAQNDTLHR